MFSKQDESHMMVGPMTFENISRPADDTLFNTKNIENCGKELVTCGEKQFMLQNFKHKFVAHNAFSREIYKAVVPVGLKIVDGPFYINQDGTRSDEKWSPTTPFVAVVLSRSIGLVCG